MLVLAAVRPTKEQLPIVLNDRSGVAVVRGAAGSGKTTTALLRLRQLCTVRRARRERLGATQPVKVLVLTFNRSLAGYIQALAEEQVEQGPDLTLTVSTFAAWAQRISQLEILTDNLQCAAVERLGRTLGLSTRFLLTELDYVLGRFPPDRLDDYLERDRDGRGVTPRVDKQRILEELVRPYLSWKLSEKLNDWHDLALATEANSANKYDVVIVDEAQDLSGCQIRAVLAHLAPDASITFVLDTVQRIYPRFHTWREVGLDANRFALNAILKENKRNTRQIAAFARPFVEGLRVDENGELPDFHSADGDGPLPIVVAGIFPVQSEMIIKYLSNVDLKSESVGILHPKGGGWFNHLRQQLQDADIEFHELAQNRNWPMGPINVGLSTLHSAKGLEFDHVIVCGVTGRTASGDSATNETEHENLRRLLAMGFGRAKKGLMLCHDPNEPCDALKYLDPSTFTTPEDGGL